MYIYIYVCICVCVSQIAWPIGYYGGEYVGMEYRKLEQNHMHFYVLKPVQYQTRMLNEY